MKGCLRDRVYTQVTSGLASRLHRATWDQLYYRMWDRTRGPVSRIVYWSVLAPALRHLSEEVPRGV